MDRDWRGADAVVISLDTEENSLFGFGLTGGGVASDYYLAGCGGAPLCQITGYWVDDALVTAPEPGSLALLAGAFGYVALSSGAPSGTKET